MTTPPALDVAITAAEGVTVRLDVGPDVLASWPRDRQLALMEAVGALTDVVMFWPGDPAPPPPPTGPVVHTYDGATGPDPGEAASILGAVGQVVHEPELPAPEPEPPAAPEPEPEPPAPDEEDGPGPDSLGEVAQVSHDDAQVVQLLRLLDEEMGGIEDDRGFARRRICEKTGWVQTIAGDVIDRAEAGGLVTVMRKERRIHSVELTPAAADFPR